MLSRRNFLAFAASFAASSVVKAEDIESVCDRARETVNRKLRYRTDMETFGVINRVETVAQAYARGTADCEEFALAYRHELIQLGVAAERIGIYWCRVNTGEAHAVCIVDKEYVLCCYLPSSVRTVARRPDLSSFRKYYGETEAALVVSIQNGEAASAGL